VTGSVETSLGWMRQGTRVLLAILDALPDADLDAPTALPGWSRRHLAAHVGFNAEALRRLAAWARTGVRTPMYASAQQRSEEIADGAGWPAERLRRFVRETAAALDADLDWLSAGHWQAEVVTAQGRTVTATQIPWMRTREVAVHAVDLDRGVDFGDLPEDLCRALVGDVAGLRSTRADGAALGLADGSGGAWAVTGTGEQVRVEGQPADLARWLTGRGARGLTASTGTLPTLQPWL
jgi:maleylpyruvate isomerase